MQKILHSFIFIILAVVVTLSGSIANAQGLTEEELSMQRMQDRMNSLEKSMSTMQQELYKNGKNNNSKSKGKPADEPIGAEDEKARAMNGKFEEMEHNINTLAAKLDKIIADIDLRIAALEKKVNTASVPPAPAPTATDAKPADAANQNAPIDTTPGANPVDAKPVENKAINPAQTNGNAATPAPAAKSDAAGQYDRAFEFMRNGKYEESEKAFKDFIANNKGNDLLGNAYYWLGETYYIRANYQQAAVNFLKGYQDYPKGNKAPDNLLKLAMSLKALKKEKESCATLDKMKKEYPAADKELLAKADAEKKGLKCK